MYYTYLRREDNSILKLGTYLFLKDVDRDTARYENKYRLLADLKTVDVLPVKPPEEIFIRKQENDEDVEFGEVLYSSSVDIFSIDENVERIVEKAKNFDFLISFLQRYIELISDKDINEKIIKNVRALLKFLTEKKELFSFSYAYFESLMVEVKKDYGLYRFAYIANKSLELEKKKVKCITKNIKGRRKIQ
jgi:hypothetical protein